MLPEKLQLTLGALVVLDQLFGAHGDAQQAAVAEDVVSIAETLQLIALCQEAVRVNVRARLVVVKLSPRLICAGGYRGGPCRGGKTHPIKRLRALGWHVRGLFGYFQLGQSCFARLWFPLRCGGAVLPVAFLMSPVSLVVNRRHMSPRSGGF